MPLIFNDHSYGVNRDISSEAKARWRKVVTFCSFVVFMLYVLAGAGIFLYINPTIGSFDDPQNVRRNNTFFDSFYFSMVTVTTVGYGDIIPQTDSGKVFTSIFVLVSMAFVALILDASNFLYEDNESEIVTSQGDLFTMRGLTNFLTAQVGSSSGRVQILSALMTLIVVIGAGVVFFAIEQEETFLNAAYFSVVSMSGIGFGDIKPLSDAAKAFCIVWLGAGTFALFRAVGTAMSVSIESRKHAWIERRARVLKELHEGNPKEMLLLPRPALESLIAKDKFVLWSLERKKVISSDEVADLAVNYDAIKGTPLEDDFTNDQGGRRLRALRRHTYWARTLTLLCLIVFIGYAFVGALLYLEVNPEYGSKTNPLDPLQENTYLDSLYFVTISLTTVGFGDITPENDGAKIFLIVYILASLPLIAFILDVTNFFDSLTHDDEFLERVLQQKGLMFAAGKSDQKDTADENVSDAKRRLVWNVVIIFVLIAAGMLFFIFKEGEDLSVIDGFYFSVSCMSGVGYGDIVPKTDEGKIFCIVWIGVGTFALFRAIGSLMNVTLELRIRAWEKKIKNADELDFAVMAEDNDQKEDSVYDMENSIMKDLNNLTDEAVKELALKQKFAIWKLENQGVVGLSDILELSEEFDQIEAKEEHELFR